MASVSENGLAAVLRGRRCVEIEVRRHELVGDGPVAERGVDLAVRIRASSSAKSSLLLPSLLREVVIKVIATSVVLSRLAREAIAPDRRALPCESFVESFVSRTPEEKAAKRDEHSGTVPPRALTPKFRAKSCKTCQRSVKGDATRRERCSRPYDPSCRAPRSFERRKCTCRR